MVGAPSSPVVNVYPLAHYTFGTKEARPPRSHEGTVEVASLLFMKSTVFASVFNPLITCANDSYMKEGMRTSVEAILLVQEHNHPHILLLQIGNTFCKLPGGRLKPGESEIEGLKRKLCSKLAVNSPSFPPNWQVGECVAEWWRPNFETVMYPYCPPHITKPKDLGFRNGNDQFDEQECKKLFIVHLTEREYFAVPRNLKLLAVPLFELYDNVQRYGPVISTIPQQLSRFQFNMLRLVRYVVYYYLDDISSKVVSHIVVVPIDSVFARRHFPITKSSKHGRSLKPTNVVVRTKHVKSTSPFDVTAEYDDGLFVLPLSTRAIN
ncbi:Cleavage and polyadenylation specificity factor subunit 5 [Triticum urartu]|uniref:Cleavage and polyadenylation specificity factor subunit 5 n=1 Tax=Triticum urartu TaxID=4572 RepID=M7ZZ81_TRIUA|nr:Cleavage and polyadenylation specificity factor subunit 5 [Triticum urartu]